jgi:fructose-1,6-bisphosphatase/inositol monophosphatase family enzyme
VVTVCERSDPEILGNVARVMQEDTIYHVDRVGEAELVAFLTQHAPADIPFILVAEGLTEGHLVFPHDAHEAEVRWRILMDPIDGTRGLMYQKRSAWILTGVAPNLGEDTALSDIAFAIQTEIPLVKQHLSDTLWAVRGQGAHAERVNRFTGERRPLTLRPSRAKTIEHGFSTVARFFPGGRDLLAALDDALAEALIGPVEPGRAQCFEDQYISTGGQLYELMAGHDRFVADVRPYLARALADRGASTGICCHPYDLCTKLIAEEAGVCIVDPAGGPVDAPLQLHHDIAWAGYANAALQALIEPILIEQMSRLGMIEPVPHST